MGPQSSQRAQRTAHNSFFAFSQSSASSAASAVNQVLLIECRPNNDPPPGTRCQPGSSKRKIRPFEQPVRVKDGSVVVAPAYRATRNPTATRSDPCNPAFSG
jgi:hypothetical protein